MLSLLLRVCPLACCLLVSGCFNPAVTRLPAFANNQPQVEKRSVERHDPFPDQFAGPDTQVRPRGFENQRTEPRRGQEERSFQQMTGTGVFAPTAPETRGSQYRDSVRY